MTAVLITECRHYFKIINVLKQGLEKRRLCSLACVVQKLVGMLRVNLSEVTCVTGTYVGESSRITKITTPMFF